MRYIPKKEGNKWTTPTSKANLGLHDQTQFKTAVAMLEDALDNWSNPTLSHLVLTGSTESTYKLFIQKLSDSIRSPDRKHWKSAMESDIRKGLHCHVMLVLSAEDIESILGEANTSTLNNIRYEIQQTHPDFEVKRISRRKSSDTPYIPINEYSLNDAADWFSYIFKVRSKALVGICYGSSRRGRSRCPMIEKPQFCQAVRAVK